ncbi:MAG: archaellin/type IV pilin N-terminal domain-containing protein [Thermoplasmata archaeon]
MKIGKIYRKKKGVSPVIATILMVAITVVLAGVLYVMVMGLMHGPGSTPNAIGFGTVGQPTSDSSGGLVEVVQIASASSGLYLSSVGFKVVNSAGQAASIGPDGIVYTTAAGVSYTFSPSSGAWSNPSSGSTPASQVLINSGASVQVDVTTSSSNLAGYTLQAYGLGSASVSGSVSLQ